MQLLPDRFRICLGTIVMILVGTLCAEEAVPDDPPFQALSPDTARRAILLDLEASEPDRPPDGIVVGKARVLPRFDETMTFSDNSQRRTQDKVTDFISTSTATWGLNYKPSSTVTFDFSAALGWTAYVNKTERDHQTYNVTTSVSLRDFLIKGLEFGVSEHYYQSGTSDLLDNEFIEFNKYETNDARFLTRYAFNRFTITASAKESIAHYFSPKTLIYDFTTDTLDLEGAYTLVPERFVLFGDLQHSWCRKPFDRGNDFTDMSVKTGVRGTYEKLNYSVAVGFDDASLTHAPKTTNNRSQGPGFLALIAYQPQSRLGMSLYAERRYFPSPFTRFSTETNARAATVFSVTKNTHFNFDVIRNENQVLRSTNVVRSGVRAGIDWKLNKPVVLTVGVSHIAVDRTDPAYNTTPEKHSHTVVNEYFVGFRLGW